MIQPFDPYADFDAIHDMENVDNLDSEMGKFNFSRVFLTCFLPEAKTASMRGYERLDALTAEGLEELKRPRRWSIA